MVKCMSSLGMNSHCMEPESSAVNIILGATLPPRNSGTSEIDKLAALSEENAPPNKAAARKLAYRFSLIFMLNLITNNAAWFTTYRWFEGQQPPTLCRQRLWRSL